MEKKDKLELILVGLFVILIMILLFYTIPAMSWEEITVWDNDWSSSSEVRVIPYSRWDSQRGSSYGYVYSYGQPYYNWIPPAERELERQEIRREDWWGGEYKEWLGEQGVSKGEMIGW